jgi:hypothetical protein
VPAGRRAESLNLRLAGNIGLTTHAFTHLRDATRC